MSEAVRDTGYVFDNAWHEERRRLAAVEAWADPGTCRILNERGLKEGWRCLEVGAGGGSIAEWLCERVGPGGRVLATDIDPRYLAAIERPNIDLWRHDIVADELPEHAFDLVHTRFVLMHLPERARALERMLRALKPGGWLVVEDLDMRSWRLVAATDPATPALQAKLLDAAERFLARRGADGAYGQRLLVDLKAQGLLDVDGEGRLNFWRGGPGTNDQALVRLSYEQFAGALVEAGWVTQRDVDTFYALLDDPTAVFVSMTVFAAWGRRA